MTVSSAHMSTPFALADEREGQAIHSGQAARDGRIHLPPTFTTPTHRHVRVHHEAGTDASQSSMGCLALVLRPFWWPMNMKVRPSMLARPHTMAGSSSPPLSPCSSTNLSVMLRAMSRKVGRLGCRATASRCTGVSLL